MTTKLVVVADLGHFKAYRLEESPDFSRPRIKLLEDWETNVSKHLSEEVTDQAGQFRKGSAPAGPTDRSDGEEHNLDLERRRRAVKKLAKRMDELFAPDQVEAGYLAASSEISRALLDALDERTRAKVQKTVTANLTKLNPDQVIDHCCASPRGLEK